MDVLWICPLEMLSQRSRYQEATRSSPPSGLTQMEAANAVFVGSSPQKTEIRTVLRLDCDAHLGTGKVCRKGHRMETEIQEEHYELWIQVRPCQELRVSLAKKGNFGNRGYAVNRFRN